MNGLMRIATLGSTTFYIIISAVSHTSSLGLPMMIPNSIMAALLGSLGAAKLAVVQKR
jgi:hypothetical protein